MQRFYNRRFIITMYWESFTCYIASWQPWTALNIGKYKPKKSYPNCQPMNATHRSPLKLVKQSMDWNNAKEQIFNRCTPRLSRYLWFTYESGGIFPTSSAVARSRFLAGVVITNISMQLALLYSELDYLTYNPTSRHGTGYTFTWPRPTVEPVWIGDLLLANRNSFARNKLCEISCLIRTHPVKTLWSKFAPTPPHRNKQINEK